MSSIPSASSAAWRPGNARSAPAGPIGGGGASARGAQPVAWAGAHRGSSSRPFAQPEIARLEEQRLSARWRRVWTRTSPQGGHAALIGELQRLLSGHPTRERFAAQLMLALYRSGRQADALEVYRDARRGLVEAAGIEPGPELQRSPPGGRAQPGRVAGVGGRRPAGRTGCARRAAGRARGRAGAPARALGRGARRRRPRRRRLRTGGHRQDPAGRRAGRRRSIAAAASCATRPAGAHQGPHSRAPGARGSRRRRRGRATTGARMQGVLVLVCGRDAEALAGRRRDRHDRLGPLDPEAVRALAAAGGPRRVAGGLGRRRSPPPHRLE